MSTETPTETYRARLDARERELEGLRVHDARYSRARLTVFGIGVALAFAAFGGPLPARWLAVPIAVFLVLLILHDRVVRRRERAERAVAFYDQGLARLDYRFAGRGTPGTRFLEARHPYAPDLDLFGTGSLFERLCSARTGAGEARLAALLLAPASPAEVARRQEAVAELAPALDLREDLGLLGGEGPATLEPGPLRAWGEEAAKLRPGPLQALAAGFSTVTVGSLALWIFSGAGPFPFLIALAVQLVFAQRVRGRVAAAADGVDAPAHELSLLSDLLSRIESEPYACAHLAELRARLDTDGVPPSQRIDQLRRRIQLLESRRNQLFAPVAGLLLWKTQCACAIERWRARCGPALGDWLDALAEIEALASLASFAFERPDAVYPALEDSPGAPEIEARGLGHPLLHPDLCVRNDVHLGREPQALVVSGSNMSGKSTLLRTLGTNVVLAQAGAPVVAESLRLTPLRLAASIRIQDSLQEGSSRFYAEIQRLRQVMDQADSAPPHTLFLLDEILHGTNSHDRGVGAEAVLRGLLDRGAIGLVTTHDLALARVADALVPRTRNVHFEDQVRDGQMEFDYRMREGVVTHSNAIALMRAVGLEVGDG